MKYVVKETNDGHIAPHKSFMIEEGTEYYVGMPLRKVNETDVAATTEEPELICMKQYDKNDEMNPWLIPCQEVYPDTTYLQIDEETGTVKEVKFGGGSTTNSTPAILNENGVIKQEHLPEGYPYEEIIETPFIDVENMDSVERFKGEYLYGSFPVSVYCTSSEFGELYVRTTFDGSSAPLFIVVDENKNVNFGIYIAFPGEYVIKYAEGSAKVDGVLRVSTIESTIETIDPKYLPEGYPHKERTTYATNVNHEEDLITEDGSFYISGIFGITELPNNVTSLVGAKVSATINGVDISGVFEEVTFYSNYLGRERTDVAAGNLHLLDNKAENLVDTGEDYCISVNVGEHYPYDNAVAFTVYGKQREYVTVENLVCYSETIHTIDEEFLPEGVGDPVSWNDLTDKPEVQEQVQADLSETDETNKAYVGGVLQQRHLPEGYPYAMYEIEEIYTHNRDFNIAYDYGENNYEVIIYDFLEGEITFIFDGVTYRCSPEILIEYEEPSFRNNDYNYYGNMSYLDHVYHNGQAFNNDNGIPFAIYQDKNAYSNFGVVAKEGDHIITIMKENATITTISPILLPRLENVAEEEYGDVVSAQTFNALIAALRDAGYIK